MQASSKQMLLITELEEILGQPFKLEKRGGVSDANVVSALGIPTLDGFGPYGDGDHTINERASKKSLLQRIDAVGKILLAFNGVNAD
jgi:glutamate carboxypeptidase